MAGTNPEPKRKSKRGIFYALALLVAGVVFAGAWYQEQINYFVKLRTWDPQAPARVVTDFLDALAEENQEKAAQFLGTKDLQPLVKDGEWQGYFLATPAGALEFRPEDLVPKEGSSDPPQTEFIYRGEGAAEVTAPNRVGKPVKYRLQMTPAGWKITEIRGGRMRS